MFITKKKHEALMSEQAANIDNLIHRNSELNSAVAELSDKNKTLVQERDQLKAELTKLQADYEAAITKPTPPDEDKAKKASSKPKKAKLASNNAVEAPKPSKKTKTKKNG